MSGSSQIFTVLTLGLVCTLAFEYGALWWALMVVGSLSVVFSYVWWCSGGSKGGHPSYKFK